MGPAGGLIPMSEEKFNELLRMLALTRDQEMTCDECFVQMAEFVEHKLAGKSIPESLKCIDEHLELCGECRDEFESLKAALISDTDAS